MIVSVLDFFLLQQKTRIETALIWWQC